MLKKKTNNNYNFVITVGHISLLILGLDRKVFLLEPESAALLLLTSNDNFFVAYIK